jgi:glycosyltransferase involved in cell wall biosynthesis
MPQASSTTSDETVPAPIAVVMISLNEAHNMAAVLENLRGFAQEIFLVDSYSTDATVDIALQGGVHVVQRRFRGFGDQWNFAMSKLPITAPWTMKLDPDERLTDALKTSIRDALSRPDADGFVLVRKLWFMGKPLPVRQDILRIWRTGTGRFSDVLVNEHAIVAGRHRRLSGILEHRDSPNLDHWLAKQNAYTTAEALSAWQGARLATQGRLFGSAPERRLWLKSKFMDSPFIGTAIFLYYIFVLGVWRAGRVGLIWALLRRDVHRLIIYKRLEMEWQGQGYEVPRPPPGRPDPRVSQFD